MDSQAHLLRSAEQSYQSGELAEAEAVCQTILASEPRHAQALHLLAAIALRQNNPQRAIEHLAAAVASAPQRADLRFQLGKLLETAGQAAAAADQFAETLRLVPNHVDAALHFGQALFSQGKLSEAQTQFESLLGAHPNLPWAHCGLGFVFYGQGRIDRAVDCYRRAIALQADFAEAHFNLGVALHAQDRLLEAIDCFQTALRSMPSLAAAHLSLATTYLLLVRPDEAAAASRRAMELAPQSCAGYTHLGSALQMQGDMDGGIAAMRRAVELDPTDAALHSNLVYALNFHPGYDAQTIFREHLSWAARHAEPLTAAAAPHAVVREPERRLRVGYVSAHFREHAVSFFVEPMIAAHDPEQFEVFCYSDVAREDPTTERYRARVAAWRPIAGHSDAQVADQIRHDKIDILVDLAGHIGGNRLQVFARKPAPVQVTYLGYQNTTGMSAMDYRLTDAHADPPGMTECYYTEKLVHLPRSFFCFAPGDPAPAVNELPALSAGQVTFASLNHINKLTGEAFAAWARILAAVPDSRLIVLAYSPGRLEANVRIAMARGGIEPGRVEVVNKRPRYEYLRLHHAIDIALDTFPFNGHTTVCDALWMGVPSIMLEGSSYASRFGGSTLLNLGLDELIARSTDSYVEKAAALATDLPRLAELRRTLRERMQASPLLDAAGFTRHLEAAYRWMWRQRREQA